MTDETKPKRVRGLKEREAAYRAGYGDGYATGVVDERHRMNADRGLAEAREKHIEQGLKNLSETSAPKRTRRKRSGNGADIGAGTNPTVIHDAVTGERTPHER